MKTKIINLLSLIFLMASAAPALAIPITGSISFADGFESLGGPNFVVSQLNSINVLNGPGVTSEFGCTGHFGGCLPPPTTNSSDFNLSGVGLQTIYSYHGFEFKIASIDSITRTGLDCVGTLCKDKLTFDASGVVTGNGFEPTLFVMNWTGNGVCIGTVESCTENVSGSWSASLVATGLQRAPGDVPEPASMMLLAIGLLGAGALVRKSR